jgi:hypothetical protein
MYCKPNENNFVFSFQIYLRFQYLPVDPKQHFPCDSNP